MGSQVAVGKVPGKERAENVGGTSMALKLIRAVVFLVTPKDLASGRQHSSCIPPRARLWAPEKSEQPEAHYCTESDVKPHKCRTQAVARGALALERICYF